MAVLHESSGRNETRLERSDRNLVELLQEVRLMQMGVQVLFAFLLTAPFATRFPELSSFQRAAYFATLLSSAGATVLLIAPSAYHRILFRLGDKEHVVVVANRFALAGLVCIGLAIAGGILLVSDLVFDGSLILVITGLAGLACLTFWCIAPLRRRRMVKRDDVARIVTASSGRMTARMSDRITTDHEEILRWVEEHGGRPATVRGTGDDAGVLRIDLPGGAGEEVLEPISWGEWLQEFDEKGSAFLYQDQKAGGDDSTFFKLVRRDGSWADLGPSHDGSRAADGGRRHIRQPLIPRSSPSRRAAILFRRHEDGA